MAKVILTFPADGSEPTVEAADVTGPVCAQLTRAFEAALGRTTADTKKPEYHVATRTVTA